MKGILFAILCILLPCLSVDAQTRFTPSSSYRLVGDISNVGMHTVFGKLQVQASVVADDDDLPFDNSSVGGFIGNWIARLLLWFIYLSVLMLFLGLTVWALTAKGFWSWFLCMFVAFCYAMWLGRYWGYDACLIFFVVLFTLVKLFFNLGWSGKKFETYAEGIFNKSTPIGNSRLLKKKRRRRTGRDFDLNA